MWKYNWKFPARGYPPEPKYAFSRGKFAMMHPSIYQQLETLCFKANPQHLYVFKDDNKYI